MSKRKGQRPLEREPLQVRDLFPTFRFPKWVVVTAIPGACAVAYRAWTDFAAGPVILGVLATFLIPCILVRGIREGVMRSNWGEFPRNSDPIGFWFNVGLVVLLYGFMVLGVLLAERG